MKPGSVFLIVAFATLVLTAQPAAATYDPVGSGSVTLTLNHEFIAYLTANGMKLTASAPAVRGATKVTLPVAGGEFDPTIGEGTTEAAGTMVFSSNRKRLPFRAVVIKGNSVPLTAKVGGGQLKVATAKRVRAQREGFGQRLTAPSLRLTAKVVTRLNKKLRPPVPFVEGQVIGTLRVRVQPATVTLLPGNRATVTPATDLLAKLNGLFVSLNPIAPAELFPGPVLSFPILSGSQIAPDGSQGTVRLGGEIELLQLSGGQLFWHEPWLEPAVTVVSAEADQQPAPPFAGKQQRGPALSLDMAHAQIVANPGTRTISVSGSSLSLDASAAGAMNQLFAEGKPAFRAGDVFGSISAAMQGQ